MSYRKDYISSETTNKMHNKKKKEIYYLNVLYVAHNFKGLIVSCVKTQKKKRLTLKKKKKWSSNDVDKNFNYTNNNLNFSILQPN